MQNAMLDSVVSSNSQELSSVEYVDSQKNPIATTPNNGLVFGQTHNGIDCALNPTAKRACDRAWCTAKQIEEWSEMPKMTLWRWLERIEKARRISLVSDMILVNVPTATGAKSTTFYNLNVLNQLAMVCIDNEKLNEVSCKFSDILSEVETTGSYGVAQPELTDAEIMSRALEIAHRTLALREERIKALEADLTSEKEAHEKDNADFKAGFDIINAQKAQIGSNREATAMATASAKSRECKRLTAENAELKDAVGRGTNWHTIAMMRAEWKREFGHAPSSQKLKEFSADLPADMQPVKDVEVKVILRNGSEKVDKLFRYHREAWEKYREYEENRRAKGKSVRDTPNKGVGICLNYTDTEIEYF